MTDKEKVLSVARSYIGLTGYDICITKLKLGMIVDWCAYSISAIMKECGFIGKYQSAIFGFASDAARKDNGKLGVWFRKGEKTPEPGDYIMFKYASFTNPLDKYSASHVGLVEAVNGNTITTLEGNVDGWGDNWAANSVYRRKTRYLSSSDVYSFYRPNWKNEPAKATTTKKSVDAIAKEVIAGKWGSGETRKTKLKAAGYDYSAVQKKVNELMSKKATTPVYTNMKSTEAIAKEVIAGQWGVGDVRKKRLTEAGYDYSVIQKKVNELMSSTPKKSVDAIAKEVIAGKWGSGETRKTKLKAAGYDYSAVQKKVNELMSKK